MFLHHAFRALALPVFIVHLRRPLCSLWSKLQLQQMAWTPWISRWSWSADGEAEKKTTTVVFCQSRFRIRILLSLFFFCHDLWRCVSVSINFQATFGSSQALRQLPGLNSAGKRSASSVSICAADVLINISCCLLDLSSELHNSRRGPSTLSLPRCTELKSLDLKTSSSIQIRKCENVWVQIVAMFLSQTVTVLGLPSLRQELKELEEQREQRRPEVEVNTGPGWGEMLNSEWLGFWFEFTSTDLITQKTFNNFVVKRTGCVKDSMSPTLQDLETQTQILHEDAQLRKVWIPRCASLEVWEMNAIGDTKSSTTKSWWGTSVNYQWRCQFPIRLVLGMSSFWEMLRVKKGQTRVCPVCSNVSYCLPQLGFRCWHLCDKINTKNRPSRLQMKNLSCIGSRDDWW